MAGAAPAETIRIALYHTELSRDGPGLMLRDVLAGDPQVTALSRVARAADPDVLVLADVDYDLNGVALAHLAEALGGFQYQFSRRPNRGLQLGRDLDADGRLGEPEDAEGYGDFAGQGGMAVLSRLPIREENVRDFTGFLWAELPGQIAPADDGNPARLSTTVHWDVPVEWVDGRILSLLIWHATAPVFDGPEDRNGRRNHDEAAFWTAYLDGMLDDDPPSDAVLVGVANADPYDGESRPEALRALLMHPSVQDPKPGSDGAAAQAMVDGGVNTTQTGPAALDTVDWPDGHGDPGNLRVDYILPLAHLCVVGAGVIWPEDGPLAASVQAASRHRLVWVDLAPVSC